MSGRLLEVENHNFVIRVFRDHVHLISALVTCAADRDDRVAPRVRDQPDDLTSSARGSCRARGDM
jgi:hypothetical protein